MAEKIREIETRKDGEYVVQIDTPVEASKITVQFFKIGSQDPGEGNGTELVGDLLDVSSFDSCDSQVGNTYTWNFTTEAEKVYFALEAQNTTASSSGSPTRPKGWNARTLEIKGHKGIKAEIPASTFSMTEEYFTYLD